MRGKLERLAAIFLIAGASAACASGKPIAMPDTFSSTIDKPLSGPAAAQPVNPCRVELADLRDARTSTDSLGVLGNRVVHADAVAWVRSGFAAMSPTVQVVDASGAPDLVVEVSIVKAYITAQTTQKAANVVLKVHYDSDGADLFYRGATEGADWAMTDTEAGVALNDALADSLRGIERDFVARCTAKRTTP